MSSKKLMLRLTWDELTGQEIFQLREWCQTTQKDRDLRERFEISCNSFETKDCNFIRLDLFIFLSMFSSFVYFISISVSFLLFVSREGVNLIFTFHIMFKIKNFLNAFMKSVLRSLDVCDRGGHFTVTVVISWRSNR